MPSLALAPTAAIELSGTNQTLVIAVAVIAVIALVMGFVFRGQVLAADAGTEKMQEIGAAVEEGAQAYLARQFKTLSAFVVIVFFLPSPCPPTPPACGGGAPGSSSWGPCSPRRSAT